MKASQEDTTPTKGRPLHIVRAGDGDPRHGSASTYTNHMCRCAPCTTAKTEYMRDLRRRRREAQAAG